MSQKIRVAISGGGVAGASLLHVLLPYPHLDVHIFESAPKFREAGVAFGIARNATAALDLIGPAATSCLDRAGGVQMRGSTFAVGQGKDAGEELFHQKDTTKIVQRANFLR